MNKSFCSILNVQEGEPLEGTAPEKDGVLLVPAKRSVWHKLDRNQIKLTLLNALGRHIPPKGIKNPLLSFYLPATQLMLANANISYVAQHRNVLAFNNETKQLEQTPRLLIAVCTDGKKDPCCAKFGFPLFRDIFQLNQTCERVVTIQCSHLGGCRFAATLICLPSGNVYGRLNLIQIRELVQQELGGVKFFL